MAAYTTYTNTSDLSERGPIGTSSCRWIIEIFYNNEGEVALCSEVQDPDGHVSMMRVAKNEVDYAIDNRKEGIEHPPELTVAQTCNGRLPPQNSEGMNVYIT